MKEMILPNDSIAEKTNREESALRKSRQRWTNALFISSILGIGLGFTGLVISGLSFFGFLAGNQGIGRLGTWMVVIVFPLMAFAAHCLDKADEAEKAFRIERCKRQGMTKEDCR
jgi:hypothetical protein